MCQHSLATKAINQCNSCSIWAARGCCLFFYVHHLLPLSFIIFFVFPPFHIWTMLGGLYLLLLLAVSVGVVFFFGLHFAHEFLLEAVSIVVDTRDNVVHI